MIKSKTPRISRGRLLPGRYATIFPASLTAYSYITKHPSTLIEHRAVLVDWLKFQEALYKRAQKLVTRDVFEFVSKIKVKPKKLRLWLAVALASTIVLFSPSGSSYSSNDKGSTNTNLRATGKESVITIRIDSGEAPDFNWGLIGYVSQKFTFWHKGIDVASSYNTAVKPVANGIVEKTYYDPSGYGRTVIIKHADGYKSIYAHLNKIEVKEQEEVDTDKEIGTVGLTGRTTGPHVHVEILSEDKQVNPLKVLPQP